MSAGKFILELKDEEEKILSHIWCISSKHLTNCRRREVPGLRNAKENHRTEKASQQAHEQTLTTFQRRSHISEHPCTLYRARRGCTQVVHNYSQLSVRCAPADYIFLLSAWE